MGKITRALKRPFYAVRDAWEEYRFGKALLDAHVNMVGEELIAEVGRVDGKAITQKDIGHYRIPTVEEFMAGDGEALFEEVCDDIFTALHKDAVHSAKVILEKNRPDRTKEKASSKRSSKMSRPSTKGMSVDEKKTSVNEKGQVEEVENRSTATTPDYAASAKLEMPPIYGSWVC